MILLDRIVDRRLDGRAEARAHVDPVRAQRERGHEAAPVAEAAARDHRDLELVGGGRDQDQAGNIVLARVAGAFEAVDRDGITPMRSAESAWRTAVHLCTTLMPCDLNSSTCSCGL